jgi:hypothetical protein
MLLSALFVKIVARLDTIRDRASAIELSRSPTRQWRDMYLAESLIGDIWQTWCNFARHFVVVQCSGYVSRSGMAVPQRADAPTKQRILYEGLALASGGQPKPAKIITHRYQEPTWGDTDRLAKILSGIGITHGSTLETIVLTSAARVKDLQIVRNACAHRSNEGLGEVLRIQTGYIVKFPIRTPSDLGWQGCGAPHSAALYQWISDVENLADLLTTVP